MISCIMTRRLLINNNQFDYLLPVIKNKEDVTNHKRVKNIHKNYLFYNKYLRDCTGLKTLKNRKKKQNLKNKTLKKRKSKKKVFKHKK